MSRPHTSTAPHRDRPDRPLYRAAVGSIDVTPHGRNVRIQGFPGSDRRSADVLTPIRLDALLLEDAWEERLLIVGADLYGFGEQLVAGLRREAESFGIAPERLVLNASRTHYAPTTVHEGSATPDHAFCNRLVNAFPDLLAALEEESAPARCRYGRFDYRVGAFRSLAGDGAPPRSDAGYPTETSLLVVESTESPSRSVMVSHGCQPTGLGEFPTIFGGYPFLVRTLLEKDDRVSASVFLQGAGGGSRLPESRGEDGRRDTSRLEERTRGLVERVLDATRGTLEEVRGPIVAGTAALEEREEETDETGPLEGAHPEVQLVTLGAEVAIAGFPGLPTGRAARSVEERLDRARPIVLGCTNGTGEPFDVLPESVAVALEELDADCRRRSSERSEEGPPERTPNPSSGRCIESGSDGVPTTTIWDYRKFRHREYPARVDAATFTVGVDRPDLFDRTTPIASMGSCFARNVARYLIENDYRYLVTEDPFEQASAHWDQVFNTACMRQIFEYTFTDDWSPEVRWWPKDDHVQDPYRRDVVYPRERCEEAFARHRAASREALEQAGLVILTLGLIETWRDARDGMTYYRVPSPRIYDPEVHEFYVQTVDDCVKDLDRICELLARHNPDASLVVTVSPVPLFATFRMDVDPVTANTLSKSTLRTAAEYFCHRHEDVHYFPSYEMVMEGTDDPFEDDNRHVTDATIDRVMGLFTRAFGAEGARRSPEHRTASFSSR